MLANDCPRTECHKILIRTWHLTWTHFYFNPKIIPSGLIIACNIKKSINLTARKFHKIITEKIVNPETINFT